MTHHLDTAYGFVAAGISTATLWVANSAPASIEPMLQAGGTVGLIGGMSIALITLWKDRKELINQLRATEAARLADKDALIIQTRLDNEKAEASRNAIINELRTQTRKMDEKP